MALYEQDIDHNEARNFEARNERTVTGTSAKRRGKSVSVDRKPGRLPPVESKKARVQKETLAVSSTMTGRSTRSCSPTPKTQTNNDGQSTSIGKPPRGNSPSGRRLQKPSEEFLQGTCTKPSCDSCLAPVCRNYTPQAGCRFGERCSLQHREADGQPKQRSEKREEKAQ